MKKLLNLALQSASHAEIYRLDHTTDTIHFENSRLKNITSSMQSGTSLRLIKNRNLGFAYTRNMVSGDQLVNNALASLREGVVADFLFPKTTRIKKLTAYDSSIEKVSRAEIANECERAISFLRKITKAQINVAAHRQVISVQLVNSAGTDIRTKWSYYYFDVDLIFPGTYAAISRPFLDKKFTPFCTETLAWLAELYNSSAQEVIPAAGKMPVLFMPASMYALLWRLKSATNARSVYKKESPLERKLGEKIFDSKFTAYDDPLDDNYPGARPCDDEGSSGKKLQIVENGILKNFYYDLNYAAKMNKVSTGHGYRSAMWNVDPVSTRPAPCLNHFFIKGGDMSFDQLVKTMDRGIIIQGCLGAHSGNIPNGDFSIGLSPGLYVEQGKIKGRIKNAMVAGNIYDLMKNIVGIEKTVLPAMEGYVPAILFESASVVVH